MPELRGLVKAGLDGIFPGSKHLVEFASKTYTIYVSIRSRFRDRDRGRGRSYPRSLTYVG